MNRYLRRLLLHVTLLAEIMSIVIVGSTVSAAPKPILPTQRIDQARSLDLVLLVDESGSAWNYTDPDSGSDLPPFRIRAAQLLVNMLAVEQGVSRPSHRVAVYFFGSSVAEVVPLQPVTGNANTITNQIYAEHYRLGNLLWTDTATAFETARTVLNSIPADPTRRSVVVMITDGKPETESANTQSGDQTPAGQALPGYLQRNTAAIQSLSGVPNSAGICPAITDARPVYLLAVNISSTDTTPVPTEEFSGYWSQSNLVGSQYRPVVNFAALSGQISLLVAELLCAVGEAPRPPVSLPTHYLLDVRENYASVMFTIMKSDSNTHTTITPPGGQPLQSDTPGVQIETASTNEVWSLKRNEFGSQWAGIWDVKVEGAGWVQFDFLKFSDNYTVALLQPQGDLHPAGKPLNVAAWIVDATGQRYTQPVQNFKLTVGLTTDDGTLTQNMLSMQPDVNGNYQARIEEPKPGRYTLNLRADLDSRQNAMLSPARTIAVEKLPWMVLHEPADGMILEAGHPFTVTVSAQAMGTGDDTPKPIDGIQARRTSISAELAPVGLSTLGAPTPLEAQSGGAGVTHTGVLPGSSTPGNYNLVLRLTYPFADRTYDEVITRTLRFQTPVVSPTGILTTTVTPPPPCPPECPPPPCPPECSPKPWWLILLGALALIGLAGWWWWWMSYNKPLSGYLDTPGGQQNLRGRRFPYVLFDANGMPQGRLIFSRIPATGHTLAWVARLKRAAPPLVIQGQVKVQGDVSNPLQRGDTIVFDGQTTTYYS